jgi:prevent-host-death family protein
MCTPLSLAHVKAHLSELVQRVGTQHERVLLTVHGKPAAVLLAPDDLAALEETIAVLSDPESAQRLRSSDAEIARGKVESESDLATAMARRRRLAE